MAGLSPLFFPDCYIMNIICFKKNRSNQKIAYKISIVGISLFL